MTEGFEWTRLGLGPKAQTEGEMAKVVTMERPAVAAEPEEGPVLLVARGRGRVGKTLLLSTVTDRARDQGRDPLIGDWDLLNASLSARYPEAIRPKGENPEDMRHGLDNLLNRMAEERRSVVLDLGGGDQALEAYARDLDLIEFCAEAGVRPVALYVLGPHEDDLRHVAAIEATGLFRPPRTIVAMNEHLAGSNPARAFEPTRKSDAVKALKERGARLAFVPTLTSVRVVSEAGVSFYAAPGRDSPLSMVDRQRVKGWLRALEGEAGFGPVLDWLP
jgi:hypothetical protein